jgi:hypothetical protein
MRKSTPLIACLSAVFAVAAAAQNKGNGPSRNDLKHVLLISL